PTGLIDESNEANNSGQAVGQDMLKVSADGDIGAPADGTTKYWLGGGSIRYSWNTQAAIGDEWIGARDADIYPVDGTAGTTLGFDVDSYTDGFDAYLRWYNSSWALLKSNDNGMAPDETSVGKDPYLWFAFPDNATYYLVVSSAENHTADPRYLTGRVAGSTGSYKLTKSFSLMPDLIGTALTATPSPVGANGLVTVNYTVTNNGGAPAGGFGIDFYLVDQGLPGASQPAVRHVDVAGLDPGGTNSAQFTLDVSGLVYGTTMTDSTQFVRMVVDHGQTVLESDESNNSGRGDGLDIATLTFEAHQSWSRPISATQTIAAGIGDELIGTRDLDVYKFAATPATTTTVTVTRTSGTLNSTVRIYDSSWNAVASDVASHANAAASFTSTYGGDYYLVVSDFANKDKDPSVFTGRAPGNTGNYTIGVTGQQPDLVPVQFTVWDAVADGTGATTVTTGVHNNG
ncbi:MAG: hypothetical protein NT031_12075, partial [Planctomycetota bacterium]|nr:hypothetical protein [Planctomycetota bacterium]